VQHATYIDTTSGTWRRLADPFFARKQLPSGGESDVGCLLKVSAITGGGAASFLVDWGACGALRRCVCFRYVAADWLAGHQIFIRFIRPQLVTVWQSTAADKEVDVPGSQDISLKSMCGRMMHVCIYVHMYYCISVYVQAGADPGP